MPQYVQITGAGDEPFTVEFPDGMSDADMQTALRQKFSPPKLALNPEEQARLTTGGVSPESESFAHFQERQPAPEPQGASLTQWDPGFWERFRTSPAGLRIFGRPEPEQAVQRSMGLGEPSPAEVVGAAVPFTLGEVTKGLPALAIAGKMAWDTIAGLPSQFDAFKKAIREGNKPEAMRQGLNLGMSAAFITAGISGARGARPELTPEEAQSVIGQARTKQVQPTFGKELKLPEGARPGFHRVPEAAPQISFSRDQIQALVDRKVKSPNGVRQVLGRNLTDEQVNRALSLANEIRARQPAPPPPSAKTPPAAPIEEPTPSTTVGPTGLTADETAQATQGEPNAPTQIRQQEGGQPEHPRTAPGPNLPAHPQEGGQGGGGQAGGGNRPEQPAQVQVPQGERGPVPLSGISKPVQDFGIDFQTGILKSTEQARTAGMATRTLADLEYLAKLRRSAVVKTRELNARAEKLSDEGDKAGALRLLTQASQLHAQIPREAIESATDTGSHQEIEQPENHRLGPRPLDWKQHPEVADWLRKNAADLGIKLPEDFPSQPQKTSFLAVVVKDPKTGQWVEGPNHPSVEQALGMPETTKTERNTPEYGFKVLMPDGSTKILNRVEAAKFADEHNLRVKPSNTTQAGKPAAHSDEVKGVSGQPLGNEPKPVKPVPVQPPPAEISASETVSRKISDISDSEWEALSEQLNDATDLYGKAGGAREGGRASYEEQDAMRAFLDWARTERPGDTIAGAFEAYLKSSGEEPSMLRKLRMALEDEGFRPTKTAKPVKPATPKEPKPAKPKNIRANANEFTKLVLENKDAHEWGSSQTRSDADLPEPGKEHLGSVGIQGEQRRSKAIRRVLSQAAKDLGLDPDQMGNPAYRAQHLQALKDFLAKTGPSRMEERRAEETNAGFQDMMAKPTEGTEPKKVNVLQVGSRFSYRGKQFLVTDVSPDGVVTVKDGPKFGLKELLDDETFHVDKGSLETPPERPFLEPEAEKPAEVKPAPKLRPGEKGTGELFQGKDQPFNLAGEKGRFVEPTKEKTAFGGETLEQNDLFRIQKVSQERDPYKSARAAIEMYGDAKTAAEKIRNQLRVMDSDPETRKNFTTEQRARLKQVLDLLDQWDDNGPAGSQLGGGAAMPAEFPGAQSQPADVRGSAGKALARFRERLRQHFQRKLNIAIVTAGRDRGDTLANVFARQKANEIRHSVNRAFTPKERKTAEDALSLVVEAKGNYQNLPVMRQLVIDSEKASPEWKKRFFDAADFALYNWDKLHPIAQRYGQMTGAQVFAENEAGIDTLQRSGYVMHLQELPEKDGGLFGSSSEGTLGTPFRKVRTHDTFADSIAAGVDPKSINAIELLETRLRRGQQLINSRLWLESLKTMRGADGLSLAAEPEIVKRADGKTYPTAPDGYTLTYAGFQPIAIRNGYEGTFKALSDPSWFRQHAAGRFFTTANAAGKSINLVFDTFHLGRIAYWQSLIRATNLEAPLPSYLKGLTLLDNSVPEILRMARNNEIPQAWLPDLLEWKRQDQIMLNSGYNIGRISDAMYEDVMHNLPFVGRFNKWLFEQYQRGAMSEVWHTEFNRIRKALPDLSEEEAARRVSHDLNVRFGNLGRQGWFKSRTAQDAARLVALAPQWNEGLIKSELGAATQTLEYARNLATGRKLYAGVLMRSVGTMALMTFVANQIINQITRGKFTWENPEEGLGAKLSAWIPDLVGHGPGFFLHPLGLAAETTHLLMNGYEHTGDWYDTLNRYLRSRSSAAMRPVLTFLTQKDFLGRTLKPGTVWYEIAKSAIPRPISGGAIYAAGKEIVTGQPSEQFPGQFQRQALASMGIKTDQAPSPEQRIRSLANRFNQEKGVQRLGEFFEGDYVPLTRALSVGNQRDAASALADLAKRKSAHDLVRYYTHWWKYPFTGNQKRERQFYQTLNPEEQTAYRTARQQRREISQKALALVRQYYEQTSSRTPAPAQ